MGVGADAYHAVKEMTCSSMEKLTWAFVRAKPMDRQFAYAESCGSAITSNRNTGTMRF